MDFEFTEEQRMFQVMMRDFVAQEITPAADSWKSRMFCRSDVMKS